MPEVTAEPGIHIHTSGRILFKRCRRKWDFASDLRRNLVPTATVSTPLWFGTGFHFALEDFHGFQLWGSAGDAFMAYASACGSECPYDAEELVALARGMLSHYTDWCETRHRNFRTWTPTIDGVKKLGCEVDFCINLPELKQYGFDVQYRGTVDSIFEDTEKRLWIGEYKTAAAFDVAKLETDDQVSAYLWALSKCLPADHELGGVVYRQFKKNNPEEPTILKSGELSVNKSQRTTYAAYRRALAEMYPGVALPQLDLKYREMLEVLSTQETEEGNAFVNQRLVYRSSNALQAQHNKILMDSFEMLNSPAITTNPTRDCAWDCPYREVCIGMDEGLDWERMLTMGFVSREKGAELWRQRLQIPACAGKRGFETDVGKSWELFKTERQLTLNG